MKLLKKVSLAVMSLCLVLLLTVTNTQAQTYTVKQGNSQNITFTYSNMVSLQGDIVVEDTNKILDSYSVKVTCAGGYNYSSGNNVFIETDMDKGYKATITVTVKIKSSAPVDATATIKFANGRVGYLGDATDSATSANHVVKVAEKTTTPSTPSTPSKPSTSKVDYTKLKEQISIADGLKKAEYTSDSWAKLATALSAGKSALSSSSQTTVDNATASLKTAIAGLVKMDYSKLKDALNKANTLLGEQTADDLWNKLFNAMDKGENLLTSTNQTAVDAAADEILAVLKELAEALGVGGSFVGEGEEFCNVSLHAIWPILFFISLAVNAVLAFMLVQNKKKNFNDNTPVVDYDINDDDK